MTAGQLRAARGFCILNIFFVTMFLYKILQNHFYMFKEFLVSKLT